MKCDIYTVRGNWLDLAIGIVKSYAHQGCSGHFMIIHGQIYSQNRTLCVPLSSVVSKHHHKEYAYLRVNWALPLHWHRWISDQYCTKIVKMIFTSQSQKSERKCVFRDKSLFQVQRFPSKRSSFLSRNTKKTHLWGLMKYKKAPCSNNESLSYLLMRSIKSQPLCAHIYFFNNLFNEIKIDRTLSALRTRNDFQGSLLAEPSRERQVSWYDSMRWGGWAVRE